MEILTQNKTYLSMYTLTNSVYVGIDPHKYFHHVLITNRYSDVLQEIRVKNTLEDVNFLIQEIVRIKTRGDFNNVIIGIEGYHGNGDFLTRNLLSHFDSIYEVPVARTSQYRRSNIYREKTDRIDALGVINSLTNHLSELSVITNESSNELAMIIRDLVMSRQRFVNFRIGLKNSIHHLMQHLDPEYVKIVKHFDSQKARKQTEEFCNNLIHSTDSLELKMRAKLIISNIHEVTNLVKQINIIEKDMENILKPSRYMKIIETYKGISFVLMSELIAQIYSIDRFSTPEKFCKYCGIAPVAFSSGSSKKCYNTHFGIKNLRVLLRIVSLVRISRVIEDKEYYQKQLSKGKTPKQARRLVMRKTALVLYALLRKDQAYTSPVLA